MLGTLEAAGLAPEGLVLEVTEGLLLQESSREALRALRAHGVRVAIDDFGTGYSSLGYLRELPVDMVKIDQAFLAPVEHRGANAEFLRAIVSLAHTLGLRAIAEGIEDPAQLDDLRGSDCTLGQGYLLARPGEIDLIPPTLTLP